MAAEIISTVERRRRWPAEEKLRIMSEALEPGAVVAGVADRNGVCRSQLYTWLRLARDDRLPGISINRPTRPTFVPVRVEGSEDAPPSSPPQKMLPASRRRIGTIEIALTNGRVVKVEESIDPATLARVIEALDGAA
jgi:transposase-like protein